MVYRKFLPVLSYSGKIKELSGYHAIQKALLSLNTTKAPNIINLRIRFQHMNFGVRDKNSAL